MAAKKNDPTVSSQPDATAPPIHEADDYAGNKEYRDNPDKPSPDTVAQVEVLPEDK